MSRKRQASPDRMGATGLPTSSPWMLIWGFALLCMATFTYFFGLDSLQIPKNGDEFPYAHIARLTADSGH